MCAFHRCWVLVSATAHSRNWTLKGVDFSLRPTSLPSLFETLNIPTEKRNQYFTSGNCKHTLLKTHIRTQMLSCQAKSLQITFQMWAKLSLQQVPLFVSKRSQWSGPLLYIRPLIPYSTPMSPRSADMELLPTLHSRVKLRVILHSLYMPQNINTIPILSLL